MIYGDLPTGDFKVFSCCDNIYLKKYAVGLIYSAYATKNPIHVHVMNPTDYTFTLVNLIKNHTEPFGFDFTVSYEDREPLPSHLMRVYYAVNRFAVAGEFLKHVNKLLIVDADCILRTKLDFGKLFDDMAYGLYFREPLNEGNEWETLGTHVAAGTVFMSNKTDFAYQVRKKIMNGPMVWFCDQVALWQVHQEMSNRECNSFSIPKSLIDWDFEPQSAIWQGKGVLKDTDEVYLREQKHYGSMVNSAVQGIWEQAAL